MISNQKLDKWADLLLDTGKRNNLINFKDTKSSTAEVLLPEPDVLFAKMEGTSSFEVFDPKIPDTEFEENPEEEKQDLTREEFFSLYAPRIRRQSKLLVYSKGGKPIAALKTIERRARDFLEETGVNVAYMAFGMIHWKEAEASELENMAPVLLVPVTLSKDSAVDPYVIKSDGSEVIVNPTFLYKLEQEYGIHLPEYGEEGLIGYLETIAGLVQKLNWTVTSECRIGIFSFLKINMYQDLKDNAELILQNRNVRVLLGEPAEEAGVGLPGKSTAVENPLVDLHCVIDADSSQIEAIELAKSGKSFVLQGPPGTGKSQTITNIIAECLSDGKKVLFVSEKQAALNVVFDKLKQAGLEDFCLELHSYKTNRKAVIDNLCRTLKADSSVVSSRVEGEIEQKKRAQKQLDEYALELHQKRDGINRSLYQLFEKHAAVRNAPDINWHFDAIEGHDEADLLDTTALLRQYIEFVPSVGYHYSSNPWYGFFTADVSYNTKLRTEENLRASKQMLETLVPVSKSMEEEFHLSDLSVNGLKEWGRLFGIMKDSPYITPELFRTERFQERAAAITRLAGLSAEMHVIRNTIGSQYDTGIYELDGTDAYNRLTRLYSGLLSRLFNADYNRIANAFRLVRNDGKKLSYSDLVQISNHLSRCQTMEQEFQQYDALVRNVLGEGYQGTETDWNTLLAQIQAIDAALTAGIPLGMFADRSEEAYQESRKRMGEAEAVLNEAFRNGDAAYQALAASFDHAVIDLCHCSITEALNKITACEEQMEKLENWCQFSALREELNQKGVLPYIDEAIKENIPAEQFVTGFVKRFYGQWIGRILFHVPALSRFSRVSQDDAVHIFHEKDTEQFEINKAVIRSRLSQNRPSLDMVAGGSSVSILLHEGGKKRRQMSIRRLLAETGDLVQLIKPCFLMSPLSVSTFLDPGVIHFDVVIFDEASQIFPQDAIGAICRADQAIIVGDSRQMPPSNFFNSSIEALNEDETDDIADFESILDLCSTAMKQLRLRWHYRSRYEQLITFSNRNFYDGDLVTFPSAVVDRKGIGIDYYHVEGLFDRRTHTNRKEAEYIVDLIYENMNRYPDRSLGVVAFSIAQQNLIDHLLNKRRLEHPESEAFFSPQAKEPFFIKNLETVQGDERDTIIFSVAYGRDAEGKLLLNFGPLSKVGGERRLNVAVTRAKCNVQLVSSMRHTDIDLNRAKSEGARLLKEYLDYAENGEVALERGQNAAEYEQYDSDFEMEVCEYLRSKGFTVDTQIGCSGYRIDMGVKKPDSSDYVLAIECDGATYHSSRNARDRDRLRQEVLERMGWKFYRVWSTDWFRNKAVEKERLLAAAEKAVQSADAPVYEAPQKTVHMTEFENNVERHLSFPPYQTADLDYLMLKADGIYLKYVSDILAVEAPLSEEFLLKRTCRFFGREKVTKVVRDAYEREMQRCENYGILRINGFLFRKDQTKVVFRAPGDITREVKYICREELASGLLSILKQNVSADKDGLYKTLAEQCGVKRAGTAVIAAFDAALQHLVAYNLVEINGDQISARV